MTYVPEVYTPRKKRPVGRYAAVVAGVAGFVLLVLNCSGLHLPIFGAVDDFNEHLNAGLGCVLPAGTAAVHSYRVASRDPEHVYELKADPDALRPFIAALTAAARARGCEQSEDVKPLYGKPGWWHPDSLPGPTAVCFRTKRPDHSTEQQFGFVYSNATGRMFVVWSAF